MVPTSHTCDAKVDMLPDEVMTIAELLKGEGYVTGGLPNNINVTRSFNFQQGFDWFDYQAPDYIAGATETASQSTTVAAAAEEMSATIGEIAGNAEKARHHTLEADGRPIGHYMWDVAHVHAARLKAKQKK